MTNAMVLAELEDLQQVLARAAYSCQIRPLGRFSRVLIAENPYAAVAIVDTESWEKLVELVSDLQAELTRLALTSERSAIRWDLYVMVHVRTPVLQSVQTELADRIESDTEFARKYVRVNLTRELSVLDRALRPFLPLRPAATLTVTEPLDLVREELVTEGIQADLVDHVLRQFSATGEVSIP